MDNIKISSGRLEVELSRPGSFYSGSRFDWTGFITEIIFDKTHRFCADESRRPGYGSGGRGLCNEFGIHEPIGYDEARVGEYFPKLGVGLLKRYSEEPYNFYKPYEVSPFEFEVETRPDSVVFLAKPHACNGYAAQIRKEISVADNRMEVRYTLDNTGTKPIDTTEYLHNFVNPDGEGIGP
ncbi:MAG: hypothetical protein N2376_14985, partial [Clostridia bacterium]|nr:hypothetical protein [Clostridia bacterium]